MRQTTRAVRAVAVLVAGGVLVVGGCGKPKPVATTAPQPAAVPAANPGQVVSQIPSSPGVAPATAPAASLGPTVEEFRAFGNVFAARWNDGLTRRIRETYKKMSPDGPDRKFKCEVADVDKQSTSSLLHPEVWVLTVNSAQYVDSEMSARFEDHFRFFWDGKRFVGLESEGKIVFPPPEQPVKIAPAAVDEVAVESQKG